MSAFNKRMKRGLRWSDHRAPGPTLKEIAMAIFAALVVVIGYLFVSYKDAQAGMIEAQERQIKTEVALVTLLNEDLLVDMDSGMAIWAKVETYGEPKNRLGTTEVYRNEK